MNMRNTILEKFKAGEKTVGAFAQLRSPRAVEALAIAGLDYIILDGEHSPTDACELEAMLKAAQAHNMPVLYRIGDISRVSVLHALDLGVAGIIVPDVKGVDDVKRLVEYSKFAPTGERGYCPTGDGDYGFGEAFKDGMRAYMDAANENAMLIPQCETVGCLEHIEEIAAMDGVDGIQVGPFDLSVSMGIPGEFNNPEFKQAIARIIKACGDNHIFLGGYAVDVAAAKANFAAGYDSMAVGTDIPVLIGAYRDIVCGVKGK